MLVHACNLFTEGASMKMADFEGIHSRSVSYGVRRAHRARVSCESVFLFISLSSLWARATAVEPRSVRDKRAGAMAGRGKPRPYRPIDIPSPDAGWGL